MDRRLARLLRARGATPEETELADRDGWLTLLVLDKLLMPGHAKFHLVEVARRAGLDVETVQRVWRALGFPELSPDVVMFTDGDVEALVLLRRRLDSFGSSALEEPLARLLEQIRAVSSGLSRIAETLADELVTSVRAGREAGATDGELALALADELDWPSLSRLYEFGLRIQVRASVWRKLAGAGAGDPERGELVLAVGFVDLVGYTVMSQALDPSELAGLVARFELLAYDTVAEHGGRVVKLIGDEVMFVAEDPRAAASIALRLTERSAVDEMLPEARAGLAYGSVLAREGDYYGPVVNLASRMVELAKPGSVVVADDLHDLLQGDAQFGWRRLRGRRLRDIGRVELWVVRPRAVEADPVASP